MRLAVIMAVLGMNPLLAQVEEKTVPVAIGIGPATEKAAPSVPEPDWRVADMAQDGDGTLWAVASPVDLGSGAYPSADAIRSLAIFDNEAGQWQPHPCAVAGDARALKLATISDGRVVSLWQSGQQSVLTLHSAGGDELWAKMDTVFQEPRLLPLAEGGLIITERGPKVVRLQGVDVPPEIVTLNDDLFLPPEKMDESSRSHAQTYAVEAGDGSVRLWSYALEPLPHIWRIAGMVRWAEGQEPRPVSHLPMEKDKPISAVLPDGDKHLLVAEAGKGLWRIPIAEDESAKEIKAPEGVLDHIEQMNRLQGALHIITCPRPTKISIQMSKTVNNHLEMRQERFFDPTKRTGKLLRLSENKLEVIAEGLDGEPGFGRSPRSLCVSPLGLVIGSVGGAPLWLPASINDVPARVVLLDDSRGFRLREAAQVFALKDGRHVIRAHDLTWTTLQLNEAEKPKTEVSRFSIIQTRGRMIEDQRHHLWAWRAEPADFARWDGKSWKPQPEAPVPIAECQDAATDANDQLWLLHSQNGPSAVLDLKTARWTTYDSAESAIGARLQLGDCITRTPYLVFSVISHTNGVTGFLSWSGTLHVRRDGKWSRTRLSELAGPDGTATGAPFFDAKGNFCMPVARRHFTFSPNGKWVELPNADTSQDRTHDIWRYHPPADCPVPNANSAVMDRHGVQWITRPDGSLWKVLGGLAVQVGGKDTSPPLTPGSWLYHAHVDEHGTAHLRIEVYSEFLNYLVVRPLKATKSAGEVEIVSTEHPPLLRFASEDDTLWHRWRVAGRDWSLPKRGGTDLLAGLLPGEHRIEIQIYDAEFTPVGPLLTKTLHIEAAGEDTFNNWLHDLTVGELEQRERAAKLLRGQGPQALPALRQAHEKAADDETLRWWLSAIIQAIERGS